MSTLRSYLSSDLIGRQIFSSYPCRSIELFTDNNGPCIPREHLLATDKDIIEWINQEGFYASEPGVKFLLRLLYQEWPQEEVYNWYDNTLKFSKLVYEHVSKKFNLSPEYLELYHEEVVPLAINLPTIENEYTTITMQCTNSALLASLNLSHNLQTGTTQGFLIFNEPANTQSVIKAIRTATLDAAHPLLLPTILLSSWKTIFIQNICDTLATIEKANAITTGLFDPALATMLQSRVDEAHTMIYNAHQNIHTSMGDFMLSTSANLARALNTVPMMVKSTTMTAIMRTHMDFRALVAAWKCKIGTQLVLHAKGVERIRLQVAVLYNMIQRRPLDYNSPVAPTPEFRSPQ